MSCRLRSFLPWIVLFVEAVKAFTFSNVPPAISNRYDFRNIKGFRSTAAAFSGISRPSIRSPRSRRLSTTCTVSTVPAVAVNVVVSKILGYCIVAGSFFLQMPQLIKIMKNKSVLGLSSLSRYSEVPINSSAVIYHYLKNFPFSSYGENLIVLIQNLACVVMLWAFKIPRVQPQEMIGMSLLFVALCAVELSLPPHLQPILVYLNLPLVLGTTLPQIIENFKQGHTGQLAILTCFLKLAGCSVRIFTTLSLIGPDVGLLTSYGTGLVMNAILVVQGLMYRTQTAFVLERDAEARAAALRTQPS